MLNMGLDSCQAQEIDVTESSSRIDCMSISHPEIRLTEITDRVQRVNQRCNSVHKTVGYFKMLYHPVLPESSDINDMHLQYGISPRSNRVESPRLPTIPIVDKFRRDIENINSNGSEQNCRTEKPDHSSLSKKVPSKIAFKTPRDHPSEELILKTEHKRLIPEPYSLITDAISDDSTPDIPEILPREPEVVLKLTGRRETQEESPRDRMKIQPELLRSAISSPKPESPRPNEPIFRTIKKKRRRMKLKRSNSKSTTASKNIANLSDTRHTRRVKRRVHKTDEPKSPRRLLPDQKKPANKIEQEVVEIYHNVAVQSAQSFSESSLRELKCSNVLKGSRKNPQMPTRPDKPLDSRLQPSQGDPLAERKCPACDESESFRKQEECLESQPIRPWFYNNFAPPNYQQPTLASKSKCVDRCYFTARFNLRNIPFVVGTSITPSHNLGLNIQQVLSLMKNKQPGLATEMRPFFIKKMGRELHSFDLREDVTRDSGCMEPQISPNFSSTINAEKMDRVGPSRMVEKRAELQRVESRVPRFPGITSNSAEIGNVLKRLHFKFEEMQTKYERLQEQSTKSKDEAVQEQLRELEDELNDKESEITAVVGLYKEVMTLKSQIDGVYHQKPSLLCIAEDFSTKVPSRMPPMSTLNYQRPRTALCSVRTPSTSTRLTGLLRQIQSFQQQLIAS